MIGPGALERPRIYCGPIKYFPAGGGEPVEVAEEGKSFNMTIGTHHLRGYSHIARMGVLGGSFFYHLDESPDASHLDEGEKLLLEDCGGARIEHMK